MKTYSKLTPEGTRDILLGECRAQREVQRRVSRVFTLRGYHEVLTPGLEYYDVFRLPGAALSQQEMYKTTDNHGRLLVVRPVLFLNFARENTSDLWKIRGSSCAATSRRSFCRCSWRRSYSGTSPS